MRAINSVLASQTVSFCFLLRVSVINHSPAAGFNLQILRCVPLCKTKPRRKRIIQYRNPDLVTFVAMGNIRKSGAWRFGLLLKLFLADWGSVALLVMWSQIILLLSYTEKHVTPSGRLRKKRKKQTHRRSLQSVFTISFKYFDPLYRKLSRMKKWRNKKKLSLNVPHHQVCLFTSLFVWIVMDCRK